MAIPCVCGSLLAKCSAISVAGVIGYPAKNLHPAAMAASAHAWFPCMKYVPGGNCLVTLRTTSYGVFACSGALV